MTGIAVDHRKISTYMLLGAKAGSTAPT